MSSGVVHLFGQPLELLGEFEQLPLSFETDHETDKRTKLTPLLAIKCRPGFKFGHRQRIVGPTAVRKQSKQLGHCCDGFGERAARLPNPVD